MSHLSPALHCIVLFVPLYLIRKHSFEQTDRCRSVSVSISEGSTFLKQECFPEISTLSIHSFLNEKRMTCEKRTSYTVNCFLKTECTPFYCTVSSAQNGGMVVFHFLPFGAHLDVLLLREKTPNNLISL